MEVEIKEKGMRVMVNKAPPDQERIKMAEAVVVINKVVGEEGLFGTHAVHIMANTIGPNVGTMNIVRIIDQTDTWVEAAEVVSRIGEAAVDLAEVITIITEAEATISSIIRQAQPQRESYHNDNRVPIPNSTVDASAISTTSTNQYPAREAPSQDYAGDLHQFELIPPE